MKKHLTIWFALVICFFLPLLICSFIGWKNKPASSLPFYGDGTAVNVSFEMKDQSERIVTEKEWKNRIVVANFFFTHCPVVCPKMTNHLKLVAGNFENNQEIIFQSFTVDPERDDVTRLKQYAIKNSIDESQWQLVTGSKKEIYDLARKNFKVTVAEGNGGNEDFIHTDKLVLLDRQQRIRGYYPGTDPLSVKQLINDIKTLENEN